MKKTNRSPTCLEEAWLYSNATNASGFSEEVFLKILGNTRLAWDKTIVSEHGTPTTLLKEWLAYASGWSSWLSGLATKEGQELPPEVVWAALEETLKAGSSDHAEEVCTAWLSARPDVWESDTKKVQAIFGAAVDRRMPKLQALVQSKQTVNVNALIAREKGDWRYTKTLLGSASSVEAIKGLMASGADPFFQPPNGPRAWDEWTKRYKGGYISNSIQRSFARELAATTMLPQSPHPAEDVWAAFTTGSTVSEKGAMIRQAAKNGFWKLKSKKPGRTAGATTLMYLASQGELNAKGVLKLVPAEAWKDVDNLGRTPSEYVWAAWAASGGSKIKALEGMPQMSPEQQAKLVWHHLSHHGELGPNLFDPLLLSPPDVIKKGTLQEKTRFWETFLSQPDATKRLFGAVLATPMERKPRRDENHDTPKITSENDWRVWRESLLSVCNRGGPLTLSSDLANVCVLMLWQEKTATRYPTFYGPNEKDAEWDRDTEKVLSFLHKAGGSVKKTFEEKDRCCMEHKTAIESLSEKLKGKHRFDRRSELEAFDTKPRRRGSEKLLSQWKSFGEKCELQAHVETKIGPLGSRSAPAL